MELHVCYGTFDIPKKHPCKTAHDALIAAGHDPKIVRTGGCYGTNPLWSGRRKIKRLTGTYEVPTLILDDGSIIDESRNIVAWASGNKLSQDSL
jgi:hypothetical protein